MCKAHTTKMNEKKMETQSVTVAGHPNINKSLHYEMKYIKSSKYTNLNRDREQGYHRSQTKSTKKLPKTRSEVVVQSSNPIEHLNVTKAQYRRSYYIHQKTNTCPFTQVWKSIKTLKSQHYHQSVVIQCEVNKRKKAANQPK